MVIPTHIGEVELEVPKGDLLVMSNKLSTDLKFFDIIITCHAYA